MTTTQEVTNGHRVSPPVSQSEIPDLRSPVASVSPDTQPAPGLFNAPVPERPEGLPITPLLAHEKIAPEQPPFPAGAYHVPPKPFAPKADSFRNTIPEGWGKTKLPDRCQFMFSDGRQCTMARSDIHPSLCVYHSDREEQLFGDPGQRCEARTLDFPELHSASRDLSTAAGVNRALAQVFRMLARGRISRQEAATFAKLGQLLLQSISAMRAESADPIRIGVPSEQREPRDLSVVLPPNEVVPSESAAGADEAKDLFACVQLGPHCQASPVPSSPLDPEVANLKSQISDSPSSDAVPASCEDAAPALAASAPHAQVPQNQHMREIHPQLSQNQHIQKCAT